jgi:hypothetical protein
MSKLIVTDGAAAKSLNPWDLEANPEAWTWLSNAPEREMDNMLYKVAASFRAMQKRAISAANVPFQIMSGKTVLGDSVGWSKRDKKLMFIAKPKDLIKRISLSLTNRNAAYLLQGRDVLHNVKGLHFLVPTTINPVVSPSTGQIDYFERSVNGLIEKIRPDDPKLVKIWLLDHTTELLPSKNTAAAAILNSAGAIYFADLFIRNFYERGGVKPHVIALKGAVFNERKEDIERGWSRFIANIYKFRAKLLNADSMDVQPIGAGVDDLKNNEIYTQAITNIALGIGMPVSELMSDFDSYATAQVDRMSWLRDDIFPLCEVIADDLNIQVFEPLGMRLDFLTETSDAETQDEVDRAKAYEVYTAAGIKPSVAAQMVGIELPEGVEYKDLDAMAEEKEAKEQAKEEADRAAALEMVEAKKPVVAEDEEKPPAKKPAPAAKWLPSLDEFKELDVWRQVAQRRQRKGEGTDFDYIPHYGGLPDAVTAQIKAALLLASSAEEVKAAFDVDFETPATETPAPAYKTDPGLITLAESLNNLADAYIKSLALTPAPQPNINVTLPPITMTANMPAQGEPSITFSPVIQPAPVENVINVPEQAAPVNNITVQPSDVKVNIPKPIREKQKVKRNRDGLIESTDTEIEYK